MNGYDAATGTIQRALHFDDAVCLFLNPNGRTMAAVRNMTTVCHLDVATLQQIATNSTPEVVADIGFVGSQLRVLTAPLLVNRKTSDGEHNSWLYVETLDAARQPVWIGLGHRSVSHATLSPDGRFVAAVGSSKTVTVWNAESGEVAIEHAQRDDSDLSPRVAPTCLQFSVDGQYLMVGYANGFATILATEVPAETAHVRLHSAAVTNLAISVTGIVASTSGAMLHLWSLADLLSRGVEPEVNDVGGSSLHFSPDGSRLVSLRGWNRFDPQGWTTLHDSDNGQLISVLRDADYVVFSPDGRHLIWWTELSPDMRIGRRCEVEGRAAFSPDARMVATSGFAEFHVADTRTGLELARFQRKGRGTQRTRSDPSAGASGLFSPVFRDLNVTVWTLQDTPGRPVCQFEGHAEDWAINAIRFVSNSRVETIGSSRRLWNPLTGEEYSTKEPPTDFSEDCLRRVTVRVVGSESCCTVSSDATEPTVDEPSCCQTLPSPISLFDTPDSSNGCDQIVGWVPGAFYGVQIHQPTRRWAAMSGGHLDVFQISGRLDAPGESGPV